MLAYNNRLPKVQGPLLYQNSGNGSSSLMELGLNNSTARLPLRICLEFQDLSLQQNVIEQVFNPGPLLADVSQ